MEYCFFDPSSMLYLIPTPIGNLEDITLRALRLLQEVDGILAEDTRSSKKLLNHFEIDKPLRSYHAHNEHQITEKIIEELKAGANLALISDAGTPAISDPGFLLVRACHQNQIPLTCLPGPTAFVPALVASGLPADKFHFEGFLPHKKGRQTRLKILSELENTFIMYESPHRLVKSLGQLIEYCGGDRPACVCRELTKIHETIRKDTLKNLFEFYSEKAKVKGEIVVVVGGK